MKQSKWCLRRFTILLIIGIMLLTTACGNHAAHGEAQRTLKEFVSLTEQRKGQKNIYLIVKAENNSYWEGIIDSVKRIGEEKGCNIFLGSSSNESEWEIQKQLLETAVAEGADAIILAPDDSVRLSETVSQIYNKGIPVILIDTILMTQDYNVCYMTDNLMAGQIASQEMLAQLKEQGYTEKDELKVAIQVGLASSQTITERLAGFCKYWTQNAPQNWQIINEIKVNGGDVDKAVGCAGEFLNQYPDVKGFFGCNNVSTVGFAKVLLEQERYDIVLVGFDYAQETAQLVDSDKYMASTMLQRQADMGRLGVEAALACLQGHPMDNKFIDTGIAVINRDTLKSKEVQELLKEQ